MEVRVMIAKNGITACLMIALLLSGCQEPSVPEPFVWNKRSAERFLFKDQNIQTDVGISLIVYAEGISSCRLFLSSASAAASAPYDPAASGRVKFCMFWTEKEAITVRHVTLKAEDESEEVIQVNQQIGVGLPVYVIVNKDRTITVSSTPPKMGG